MAVTVHVQNFQSIRDATLVIDGLTVVTGTNNSGKTALQRALRGCFQNTGGTAFIRHGAKECSVEVTFDDAKVKWVKGVAKKSRPHYILNDGEPIYPGRDVPDEVAALGVCSIPAGGHEVWPTIAQQFTGQVFLLDKPGSALAEAVADVERVGQLNRALRSSESDRRSAQSELKVRKADLFKHEEEAKRFDGLDDVVALVDNIGTARKLLERLQRAHTTVSGLRDRLVVAQGDVAALEGVGGIVLPTDDASEVLAEYDALVGLRDRLATAQAEVARYEGLPDADDEISLGQSRRILTAVLLLEGLRTRFTHAVQRVADEQAALGRAQDELVKAQAEALEALAEVGTCPVCGGEVET